MPPCRVVIVEPFHYYLPYYTGFQVEVLVPPAVVVRDKTVTERKGEDVTLRCAARGNPNPRITWTKKVGDSKTNWSLINLHTW